VTDVLPTPTAEPTDDIDRLHADLERAKQATAGTVPLIQSSLDGNVELPRGIHHNGVWQRKAFVRELTGVDEEALARVREVFDMYDTVLSLGTVRIGELDLSSLPLVERQGHLQQLLLGERDQLYVAIIQATYGDRKTVRYTCQNETCGEEQDLILTLSEDFKPKVIEDIDRTDFEYRTSKGDVVRYRPAIGSDQYEVLKRRNATMAEQNSIMLSRCIREVNGALVIDPLQYARELSMPDRYELLQLLVDRQPNIDMTVTIECVACREEQIIPLGWGDLFRP
jgi:hypothetical protein